jgi:hypothetical protein
VSFTVTINTDYAAFEDRNAELARILRRLADRLDEGLEHGRLLDFNGNMVGRWAIEEDAE